MDDCRVVQERVRELEGYLLGQAGCGAACMEDCMLEWCRARDRLRFAIEDSSVC